MCNRFFESDVNPKSSSPQPSGQRFKFPNLLEGRRHDASATIVDKVTRI